MSEIKNIEYLKEDFLKSNYFKEKFSTDKITIEAKEISDLSKIFTQKLEDDLNITCDLNTISNLHHLLNEEYKTYDQNHGLSKLTKVFAEMPEKFYKKCQQILKNIIRDLIGEDFYFQLYPTLRVQIPHPSFDTFYPVYHSDIQNGHPPYMINIWIPINHPSEKEGHGFNIAPLNESINIFKDYDFNIIKIQEDHKKFNYLNKISSTENCKFGSLILFDPRKMHSTMPLKNHVRVSIDLRIVPVKLFKSFNRKYESVFGRRKSIYEPGGFYNTSSIDQI